jgi:hypothetical protein
VLGALRGLQDVKKNSNVYYFIAYWIDLPSYYLGEYTFKSRWSLIDFW